MASSPVNGMQQAKSFSWDTEIRSSASLARTSSVQIVFHPTGFWGLVACENRYDNYEDSLIVEYLSKKGRFILIFINKLNKYSVCIHQT